MKWYLLFLAGFFLVTYTYASPSPLPANGSFAALGRVQYFVDSSGRMTLTTVLHQPYRFLTIQENIPHFGQNQPPHWLRFRVENRYSVAHTYIIEVDYAFLLSAQFFLLIDGSPTVLKSLPVGWKTPVKRRLFGHRNPLFRFVLPAKTQGWIYVRGEDPVHPLVVPLQLWSETGFWQHDRFSRLWWGGVTGFLGCIATISLLLGAILRKRVYVYYFGYIVVSGGFLIAAKGLFLEWFDWPTTSFMPAQSVMQQLSLAQPLAFLLFIRYYILPPGFQYKIVRYLYRLALVFAVIIIPLPILGAWYANVYVQQNSWIAPLISVWWLGAFVSAFYLVCWIALATNKLSKREREPAFMYLIAIFSLLGILILSLLRNYHIIPESFLLRLEAISFSYLLEFTVLSLGLGLHYKRMADDRRQLAEATLQQQKQAAQIQYELQSQRLRAVEAQLRLQQEKERIARDLHDHVGSQLSVIAANLDHVGDQNNSSADVLKVSTISGYAREAIQSLRDTIWAIHQEQVTVLEFRLKIQQYLQRHQELVTNCLFVLEAPEITYQTAGNFWLTSVEALNLFRIVQEALNNAIKYAHTQQIVVALTLDNKALILSIRDNGVGFTINQVNDVKPHYGLANIQQRATDSGGQCLIESQLGHGTTVTVVLPKLSIRAGD